METLHVGQRVKFEERIYTIIEITKPIGTYEIYKLNRGGSVRNGFRYQLDPNFDFYSDDDAFLSTINLDDCHLTSAGPTKNAVHNDGGRFAKVTDKDLDDLQKKRNEKNTDKQTQWGVKVFKDWLLANGFSSDFELLDAKQLNEKLRRFYAEARSKDGQIYSKSSLVGIRAAINRHLSTPPWHSTMILMQDREFKSSNHVLQGLVKEQMRQGLDVTDHKEPLSESDLTKLYTSRILSNDTPQSLVRKVWFEIEYYFGRRGREGLRDLREDSFLIETDDQNKEYVRMRYNEADKNHHGLDSREKLKKTRMYATGGENCPVASFKLYLEKRNKDTVAFFQRPLKKRRQVLGITTKPWG